jgi:hypothetical protein
MYFLTVKLFFVRKKNIFAAVFSARLGKRKKKFSFFYLTAVVGSVSLLGYTERSRSA